MQESWTNADELMDRAAAGDDGAFGLLAAAVQDDIFRFALARGLRIHDAAEAVQESLLRAFRGRLRWRLGGSAKSWLYGITMNVVREFRRRRSGRQISGLDIEFADALPDNGDESADATDLEGLAAAISQLPDRQMEVIICRFLRHMSVKETAGVMDCAEGTVKAAVFSALENLRRPPQGFPRDGGLREPLPQYQRENRNFQKIGRRPN